jgi:hypothetical protein
MAARGIEAQKAFVAETFGRVAPERLALFEGLLVELRDLIRKQDDSGAEQGAEA